MNTVDARIFAQAQQEPQAVALLAPGYPPRQQSSRLTYASVHRQIDRTARQLAGLGIRRNDRVALALPQGPELALIYLGVTACSICAPLNPAYRPAEFRKYFKTFQPSTVIVEEAAHSTAAHIAAEMGITVAECRPLPQWETEFPLHIRGETIAAGAFAPAAPGDIALLLQTSGTTGTPKAAPLSHANLCAAVDDLSIAANLSAGNRTLALYSLYHVGGLVSSLLPALFTGGSVVCPSAVEAARFLEWLAEYDLTWVSGPPSFYRSLLARVETQAEPIPPSSLRMIRIGSASPGAHLVERLERTFGVPVLETYALTETSAIGTATPLPPLPRKPGSAGLPTGSVEIAITDGNAHLGPGATGEILLRGPSVITGYWNNPGADAESFVDGWFRTGDLGYLDQEGYLFVTGRRKEMINRGGLTIAPLEIDQALLSHPAVAEAAAFAFPDHHLGEEVAAAVVLRSADAVTPHELQRHTGALLADFKVPRRIVIVDKLPKTHTGKVLRLGLAEHLGLDSAASAAPVTPERTGRADAQVEAFIRRIWQEELGLADPDPAIPFTDLGGDSISAARIVSRIRDELAIDLTLVDFSTLPTIAQQAAMVQERLLADALSRRRKLLRPSPVLAVLHKGGPLPPFFLVPPAATTPLGFARLAAQLGADRTVYGFNPRGLDDDQPPHTDLAEAAAYYITAMQSVQPSGPYLLGGRCFGGHLAQEMARQIEAQGHEVLLLVLFDPAGLRAHPKAGVIDPWAWFVHYRRRWQWHTQHGSVLQALTDYFLKRPVYRLRRTAPGFLRGPSSPQARIAAVYAAHRRALREHTAQPITARIVLYQSEEMRAFGAHCEWQKMTTGEFETVVVPGVPHQQLLEEPHALRLIAQHLAAELARYAPQPSTPTDGASKTAQMQD